MKDFLEWIISEVVLLRQVFGEETQEARVL